MPILPYRGVWPVIDPGAFIAPDATIVGDVRIGPGASVWFGAVLRGDVAAIRVGARSNVQDTCVLHVDEGSPCVIGEDCTLGHGAIVHGATLGNRVLVGMRATVLTGTTLGDDVIIAAGAVVPEHATIASGSLALGVPARVARPISEAERERILSGSAHYQQYARDYAQALREARTTLRTQPLSGGPPDSGSGGGSRIL
jgi:carbonic anhydrase/acetyltransferase-like protein (isoleucine patch superfamily)